MDRIETGRKDTPPIDLAAPDEYVAYHVMDPTVLRADDIAGFVADREERLISVVYRATGHSISRADAAPDEEGDVPQDDEGSTCRNLKQTMPTE